MLESVFLGCQDFSPSVSELILISLKLLLFFLQALCSGYKPALEALLFDEILWHGKFVIAEAHLILREGHVIIVIRVFIYGLFVRAGLPVLPSGLFETWLGGVVFVIFGIVRRAIIS